MKDILENLNELINSAKATLSLKEGKDVDLFLTSISEYLDKLEIWQKKVENISAEISDKQKETLKLNLAELKTLHEELLSYAGGTKEEIGRQLREITHRASGLRKYVDTLPSRITIAGKREG